MQGEQVIKKINKGKKQQDANSYLNLPAKAGDKFEIKFKGAKVVLEAKHVEGMLRLYFEAPPSVRIYRNSAGAC